MSTSKYVSQSPNLAIDTKFHWHDKIWISIHRLKANRKLKTARFKDIDRTSCETTANNHRQSHTILSYVDHSMQMFFVSIIIMSVVQFCLSFLSVWPVQGTPLESLRNEVNRPSATSFATQSNKQFSPAGPTQLNSRSLCLQIAWETADSFCLIRCFCSFSCLFFLSQHFSHLSSLLI